VNIPHVELRERLNEVPKDRPVVLNCAIGLRGYIAERILKQHGYEQVVNLTGGYRTWKAVQNEADALKNPMAAEIMVFSPAQGEEDGSPRAPQSNTVHILDACGLQCPGPILKLKQELDAMTSGDMLKVLATDPGFNRDVQSWCNLTGNQLVSISSKDGKIEAVIEKGAHKDGILGLSSDRKTSSPSTVTHQNGATLIVFSNDMDKALAAFVLANGAASVGREVTMFFTFWGLSVIRKSKPGKVKKDFMGKMFGAMLPKGMDKLALSKMNFAGMGPKMMSSRMKSKNVDQLQTMLAQARMAGVHLVACQMSMDIMGIQASELIDGIEIGGVATYMEAAASSGVNLFV
jgi:peroxiredoxin family protein/TusA-related sulfurtransferase